MVVKGHDVDLPKEFVGWAVVDGDWKISSIVETPELRGGDRPFVLSTSLRLLDGSFFLRLCQRGRFAAHSGPLLECGASSTTFRCSCSWNWGDLGALAWHMCCWEVSEWGML